MKIPRRRFLHLTAGAAALPATSHFAWAQAYPTRPVRIIVAAAPGGANDVVARLMATWLSERLGQFVVENRPGGSNNIGTEAAVRATPDGYTLLLVDSSAAINATLYDRLNFILFFSATLHQSTAFYAFPTSWWHIRQFRRIRFPSLSHTPGRTPAELTWHRPGPEAAPMSLESYSRWRRQSTWLMCRTAGAHL